jgi:hypothetical protein
MKKIKKDRLRRLVARYEKRVHERRMREERERPFKERVQAIFEAPRYVITDFYCRQCNKDVSGTAFRQVCTMRQNLPTAWFVSICPKGHRIVRRITDKDSDPYYDLSPLVARQRFEMRDDLLDPSDPRFKILYPAQYAKLFPNGEKTTDKK